MNTKLKHLSLEVIFYIPLAHAEKEVFEMKFCLN